MDIMTDWKQKYDILKSYISSHPEIYIDPWEIAIPAPLRDIFYGYFDDVRKAIVKSWNNTLNLDTDALGKSYQQSEKQLLELLAIKQIDLPVDLKSFLHNPEEGMARWLYNRLFDLIQGKITEDVFERMAESDLASTTMKMFRIGYEPWAALALILLLEPDEILGVALDDDYEPFVTEIEDIAFGRQFHHPAKRIPEFILHSKKLDSHIAFKMPLEREVDSYFIPVEFPTNKLLKDRNGDTSSVLDYRMIFLSRVRDLKKIPVFADIHARKINGPDITIEFLMSHDLADTDVLLQVRNRIEIMKPSLGGSIVVMNPETESNDIRPEMDIYKFSVGMDPTKLQLVIDRLI